ncbi:2Fe-2S iron-sulfur cluster binding domain-containing protein [Xenorhabdus nematophila]|uniref:2Fe-2S iron-sulfur cluster-binding protein n=1 Tax=Xenorhabdus nematophila TaxID=628 RepID=UPI0003275944|nr:2Fe-2S iron-sulfur cluster-binding protein [Xenorhabdus nematophila]CEF29459.1 Phenylacetate-CoA oxygenase/reductase subunit PaaK [Xenorhabdus nematophila str. Websteri]KHD27594.1 hypothetical protein LH67_16795 [Xenorhabdus nematophila]MBA0018820.1 2Fe-2S iron-sulfur cluster binding domain-containing protein [Xenorhabdus nematophila]MCB4426529.1 2Fe-2S iron-sulfur cluster binding domain-containing protein [Xenorhabdus nematophila]CCW28991.1 Phenylacetate-CoA oxygenase/reductase subunit Paa
MSKFYPLQLIAIKPDTPDSVLLTLKPLDGNQSLFHYQPGQHLTLRTSLAGKEVRRNYSLCNAPDFPYMQIAIKKIEDGLFSEWAHSNLKVGDTLEASLPTGNFSLPIEPDAKRHYAGFSAGSGITSILSILQAIMLHETNSRFTLVYCNRNLGSMQFRDILADLKDRYPARLSLINLFSSEEQEIELLNGRLDSDRCRALLQNYLPISSIDYAYICGPLGMMADVRKTLIECGLVADKIRIESYDSSNNTPNRQSKRKINISNVSITATIDGTQHRIDVSEAAENLLDTLLQSGLSPNYSCKAGVCATCRCRVLAGEVEMDSPNALAPEEIAAGYILSCCSRPLTPKLTLLFS